MYFTLVLKFCRIIIKTTLLKTDKYIIFELVKIKSKSCVKTFTDKHLIAESEPMDFKYIGNIKIVNMFITNALFCRPRYF